VRRRPILYLNISSKYFLCETQKKICNTERVGVATMYIISLRAAVSASLIVNRDSIRFRKLCNDIKFNV
jgi:hypothetical protein